MCMSREQRHDFQLQRHEVELAAQAQLLRLASLCCNTEPRTPFFCAQPSLKDRPVLRQVNCLALRAVEEGSL